MKLDDVKFTGSDVIKLIGFLGVIGTMWYDLKTNFEVHKAEHKLLEYRIASLEKSVLASVAYNYNAILPKETKLEDDK